MTCVSGKRQVLLWSLETNSRTCGKCFHENIFIETYGALVIDWRVSELKCHLDFFIRT